MVVHRRAVLVSCAAGLLALGSILLLMPWVTHPQAKRDGLLPGLTAPQVRAGQGEPLNDDERTVSMRERADAIARAQVWRAPATSIGRALLGADRRAPAVVRGRVCFARVRGRSSNSC